MVVEIKNRKAYFDYTVLEEIEAGIVLTGEEVKAIRSGKVNLKGSWCNIINGEMYVLGMHISNYQDSDKNTLLTRTDPYKDRKLLLHKKEINKLEQKKKLDGLTFIPLKLYFSNGKVKVLLGVCRGKKQYDKRECEKNREIDRKLRNY